MYTANTCLRAWCTVRDSNFPAPHAHVEEGPKQSHEWDYRFSASLRIMLVLALCWLLSDSSSSKGDASDIRMRTVRADLHIPLINGCLADASRPKKVLPKRFPQDSLILMLRVQEARHNKPMPITSLWKLGNFDNC